MVAHLVAVVRTGISRNQRLLPCLKSERSCLPFTKLLISFLHGRLVHKRYRFGMIISHFWKMWERSGQLDPLQGMAFDHSRCLEDHNCTPRKCHLQGSWLTHTPAAGCLSTRPAQYNSSVNATDYLSLPLRSTSQ